jgi:predicted small secreted protein
MRTKLIYGLAASATVRMLTACNRTTRVGKDIVGGGRKIQQESKDNM